MKFLKGRKKYAKKKEMNKYGYTVSRLYGRQFFYEEFMYLKLAKLES